MWKRKKLLIWLFSTFGLIVPLVSITTLSCTKISKKEINAKKDNQQDPNSNIKNETQSEKEVNENNNQDSNSKNESKINNKKESNYEKEINENQTKNIKIHGILSEIFKTSRIDVKNSFLAKKSFKDISQKDVMIFLKQHIFENSLFKNAKVYFEKNNLEIISISNYKDDLEVNFFYKTKQNQKFNFFAKLYNFKKNISETNNEHQSIQEQISSYLKKINLNYASYLKSINREININFISASGVNLFDILLYIKSLLPKKLNSIMINHNLINLTNVKFAENETELNFNISYQGKIDTKDVLKIKGFTSVKKVTANSKEYLWLVFSKFRKNQSVQKSGNKNPLFDINNYLTNVNDLNLNKLFYNKDLKKAIIKILIKMNFDMHLINSNLLSFRIQSINHNTGKIFLVVSLSGNVYHYSFVEIIGFNKKSYSKEQKQDEITYFKQLKPQEMINELYQRISLQKINISRLVQRLNDLGWENDAQEIRNLYLNSIDNFNLKAIFKAFIDDNFLGTASKNYDYSWTNFYNIKKDYLLNKISFQMKIKNITTEHNFELSGFKLVEL